MRQGWNERFVTELVAATEHVTGLNKVAMGLLIEPDIMDAVRGGGTPGVASLLVVTPGQVPRGLAPGLWSDIQERERERLGVERVPGVWRVLGLNPRYLDATWRKDRLVLSDGTLDATTKLAVALAVSMTNGCRYFIEYYATALRRRGFGDHAILEIMGVVDHYNCLNKLADGMQIESDITPQDLLGRRES